MVKKFIASGGNDATVSGMPATFGQMLTAAREERGVSIEDASHETRIPVERLRLLEAGNYAAFGSMAYARAFIRAYSDFLNVDPSGILEELPGGALGGERDYRYLTRSHGPWLRDRNDRPESVSPQTSRRLHSISSPVPAAITVFVLVLAGTAMWGKHMAETRQRVELAAPGDGVPSTTAEQMPVIASKPRQIDFAKPALRPGQVD